MAKIARQVSIAADMQQQAKALPPAHKPPKRPLPPHPAAHGHKPRTGDGAANWPVSARHRKLKPVKQTSGKKRNCDETSQSSSRSAGEKRATIKSAAASSSAQGCKPPIAPPRTASAAPKKQTAGAALVQSIKNLDSRAEPGKRLTFVPMSAWVNNAGEEDAALERGAKALAAGDQSNKRDVRWPGSHVIEEASVKSVSTFEQQFSLDAKSTSSSSSAVPTVELAEQPSSPWTRTPHPGGQTSSTASLSPPRPSFLPQRPPLPPPSPLTTAHLRPPLPPPPPPTMMHSRPPPFQPLPQPPPLTVSVGSRRVLRHPTDVAALLHEVIKGSSGVGEPGEKGPSCQVGKAKKSNDAAASSNSQDSGILDALARIIADRIALGDNKRDCRKSKRKQSSLDLLKVNRALLATGESNCNGVGKAEGKKAAFGLRSKLTKCYSSQQKNCNNCHEMVSGVRNELTKCYIRQQNNCNNCYERTAKKVRYLNHGKHLSDIVSRHASYMPNHSSRCDESDDVPIENQQDESAHLHETELLSEKLSPEQQQVRQRHHQRRRCSAQKTLDSISSGTRPLSFINDSNATSHVALPKSSDLFFERANPVISDWKSASKPSVAAPPSASTVASDSLQIRRHGSNRCSSAADNHLFKPQRLEVVMTSTGTLSTEEATFIRQNFSAPNCHADCRPYPKFDCADWHETTEGISLITNCSVAIESTVDSPTETDKSRQQPQQSTASACKQPSEFGKCSAGTVSATAAAEYTQQLFGSLLMSRDESGFVRPLSNAPSELSIKSTCQDTSPVDGEAEKLLHRSPLKIFVPEFMLRGQGEGSISQSGQGSSEAHNVMITDLMKCGDSQLPIPPVSLTPELQPQPDNLDSPSVHKAVELPSTASLLFQLAECIDEAAKSLSKKPHQSMHKSRRINSTACSRNQPDYRIVRRRSRIHVTEPLADAVQQQIELPTEIIEKLISSWRPMKYSHLVMFIVPISSTESILETTNEPVSLFCHYSGSVITADTSVTMTVSNGNLCYGIESNIPSFARRVASRIIESLGISNILFDSPVVASLLNQSLIKPGIVTSDLSSRDRYSSCIGFMNHTVDITQHRSSGMRHKDPVRGSKARAKCGCFCDRAADQDIELFRVASNLAVRFRRVNHADRRSQDRRRHCRHSRSSRVSRGLLASDTNSDAESAPCAPRFVPDSLSHRPSAVIAEVDSVADDCSRLESVDRTRTIVTHCPELVTNPNLALEPEPATSETVESCAINSGPPGYTIDTATSDFMSGDAIAMQLRGVIPRSDEANNGALLNITCQLTVADQAMDSGSSYEESISSDCSEIVCA